MEQKVMGKAVVPLFIVFMAVNGFCTFFKNWLAEKGIDPVVLGFANVLLFLLSLGILLMQRRALKNPNPNVFIRSVMAGTFIKLIVIAVAVTTYLLMVGDQKNVFGIVGGMVLYLIYTVIEVRTATKLNRQHGRN